MTCRKQLEGMSISLGIFFYSRKSIDCCNKITSFLEITLMVQIPNYCRFRVLFPLPRVELRAVCR